MMLKLKLQYFGHLMRRVDSLEKTLKLGWIRGRRRRGRQRTRWLVGITDSMVMCLSKFWEMVKDRDAWRAAVQGVTKSRIWLSDWTEMNWTYAYGSVHIYTLLYTGLDPWVRKIPWKWQPTPGFLPREFHGQRSLVGYGPKGCKESDTSEQI